MAGPNHSEDEAKRAFRQHVETIFWRSIRGAYRDYRRNYSPRQRLIHSKRTQATIIYDHARARLDRGLANVPDVAILTHRGLTLVILNDEYLIKVPKKLSRRFLSRTYPTEQTLDFLNQSPQGAFPFLSNRTSMIVGYVPNEPDTDVAEIWATCPNGPKLNHYKFQLHNQEASSTGTIAPPSSLPPDPFMDDTDEEQQGGEK